MKKARKFKEFIFKFVRIVDSFRWIEVNSGVNLVRSWLVLYSSIPVQKTGSCEKANGLRVSPALVNICHMAVIYRKRAVKKMNNSEKKIFFHTISILLSLFMVSVIIPANAFATQMHSGSEGIIVHQLGHLFFLFSMVIIIFAINGKDLDKEKGWRLIQYSAFLFILWNIDAMCAHFLDNQIHAVKVEHISPWIIKITNIHKSSALDLIYYFLKLDHIFCVPAVFLLYKGLSLILETERKKTKSHAKALNKRKNGI